MEIIRQIFKGFHGSFMVVFYWHILPKLFSLHGSTTVSPKTISILLPSVKNSGSACGSKDSNDDITRLFPMCCPTPNWECEDEGDMILEESPPRCDTIPWPPCEKMDEEDGSLPELSTA